MPSFPKTQTPGRPQGGYFGNGQQSQPGQSATGSNIFSGTSSGYNVPQATNNSWTGGGFDWGSLFGEGSKVMNDIIGGAGPLVQQYVNQQAIRDMEKAQKKANEANEARYGQVLGNIDNFRTMTDQRMNVLGQRYKDQIGTVMGSYDTARGDLENVGREAKRRITESGMKREAKSAMNMQKRGFGNVVSVTEGAVRGIQSDTDKSMLDAEEAVGGLQSNLEMQRAQARRQVENDLNNFIMQRTGFQYGMTQDKNRAIEARTDQANWMQLLPLMAGSQQGFGAVGGAPGVPGKKPSKASKAMSGAASGAAAGTAVSPGWGTLIGAGIGAAGGYFG